MIQDVLDKFLKEVSYKFPKGYPDMANPEDVKLLNKLVMEYTEESPKDFKQLMFGDLIKRGGGRLEIVASMIANQKPFIKVGGQTLKLDFAKQEYADLFKNRDAQGLKKLSNRINTFPFFIDEDGDTYSISDLVKSEDLGGKGKGSGTVVEDREVGLLNDQITQIGNPITITIGDKSYQGITHVQQLSGNRKADFALMAGDTPKAYISHKDGTTAKDFQQYSGFKGMENEPEIVSFVNDVEEETNGQLKSKQSFRRAIQDPDIKLRAVYGINAKQSQPGPDNCQAVVQGRMGVEQQEDGTYQLKGSKIVMNPQIPDGDYEPTLLVTYRSDRNSQGVKDARFGIYAAAFHPSTPQI